MKKIKHEKSTQSINALIFSLKIRKHLPRVYIAFRFFRIILLKDLSGFSLHLTNRFNLHSLRTKTTDLTKTVCSRLNICAILTCHHRIQIYFEIMTTSINVSCIYIFYKAIFVSYANTKYHSPIHIYILRSKSY